jgi:hypothetical protein
MTTNEQPLRSGQPEQTEQTSDPGSTASGTSSPSPETRPADPHLTEAEKAAAVTALLNGEPPKDDAAGEDEGDGGGREPGDADPPRAEGDDGAGSAEPADVQQAPDAPATVQEAAERLGIDAADLYKLTITTGDGETVTLGDLKDAHQSRQAAERETAQRAAALDERETAIIAEQRLWAEMGDTLAQAITPEQRTALKERLDQRDAQERRLMVQAMPEMADPNTFAQFRDDAMQLLTDYGYKPHEVVVGDHRQLLILRDLMRAKKRLKDLASFKPRTEPPQSKKPQGRGRTSNRTAAVQRAMNSRHEADKVAGVAALLNGD